MNNVVTSKEEILKTSRELIRQQGWLAVSIRSVAAACGVSVESVYNPSQSPLLKFPLSCGDFLSGKMNIVQKKEAVCESKTKYSAVPRLSGVERGGL